MDMAEAAQHTPGPWKVDGVGLRALVRGDDLTIVAVRHRLPSSTHEANARLIAAAPDLLAALRAAIGALEFSRDFHSDLGNEDQAFAQDQLDVATAAIAKATSQQPLASPGNRKDGEAQS